MKRSGYQLLLVCLLLVCPLSACRDQGAEAFARAQMQYRALVALSAPPDDARFEPVLTELAKVPPSSKHFAQAQALIQGLQAGRSQRIRTPLALAPNGRRPAQLEAQLQACARLAQVAGADGGVDGRALAALDACRLRAEKLELQFAHGNEEQP